jgi:hypothetical protein
VGLAEDDVAAFGNFNRYGIHVHTRHLVLIDNRSI